MSRVGPWIQPPDVSYTIHPSSLNVLNSGTGSALGFDPLPYSVASITTPDAVTGADVSAWQAFWDTGSVQRSVAGFSVVRNNPVFFTAADPVFFPPGWTGLEYESDAGMGPGTVIPAAQTMHATLNAQASAQNKISGGVLRERWHGGSIYVLPAADYPAAGVPLQAADVVADLTVSTTLPPLADVNTPGDPTLTYTASIAVTAAPSDGFVFLDAFQRAGVLESPAVDPDTAAGVLTISAVTFTGTYTPSRYRFRFAGRTPLRGRQRASGVIGDTPLRGRQGDRWGLRGRQNSNL